MKPSVMKIIPIILESMDFPDPVIEVAIEPKTKADQDKMAIALSKLGEEDPTFQTATDEETGKRLSKGWVNSIWRSLSVV